MITKELKGTKAITLIAMVISILVLLILAGVSVSLVVGETGITQRAVTAKKMYDIAGAKEQVELLVEGYIGDYYGKKYTSGESVSQDIGTYIATQLASDTNVGDYNFTIEISGKKVTLTKNSETVAVGTIGTNGVVKWINSDNNNQLEIPEELVVGSVISWTPNGSYHWNAEYATSFEENTDSYKLIDKWLYSGNGTNELTAEQQADSENFTINEWKVLDIDRDNKIIKIVPATSMSKITGPVWNRTVSGTVVGLNGAQGYNNAVKLLNDACSALYGEGDNGITARSIKIEDIEELIDDIDNVRGETQYSSTNYLWYPAIYAQEKNSVIDGKTLTSGLGLSEAPNEFIERRDSNNIITEKYQAEDAIEVKEEYYNLGDLQSVLGNRYFMAGEEECYWLASRCIRYSGGFWYYGIQAVEDSYFNKKGNLYDNMDGDACGDGMTVEYDGLFPVVTINSGNLTGNSIDGFAFEVE